MRIELNYQAETLEAAICAAIVTYPGYGMPVRSSISSYHEDSFETLAITPEKMWCKD
jgi:hypothetical protein